MDAWARWWNMAQALAAAQLLAKEGEVRSSASRAYYAAYQSVRVDADYVGQASESSL